MTTPSPQQPRRRLRRLIPRGRGVMVVAALVAILAAAGVVAALLVPGGDHRGPGDGPFDIGLSGKYTELGALDDPGPPGGGPHRHGPGGPDGPGGGLLDRLGDDTLLAGTVVSTVEGSLVITPDGAPQRTLRTDDDTRVRGDGNQVLGDLQPGERVVVRVDGIGDAATVVSVFVPQARVTGTVTALTGDRATVVGVGGLTVTVDVAGLSQKPAVGDLVVLTGTAADGSTLVADGIRVLPKAS